MASTGLCFICFFQEICHQLSLISLREGITGPWFTIKERVRIFPMFFIAISYWLYSNQRVACCVRTGGGGVRIRIQDLNRYSQLAE